MSNFQGASVYWITGLPGTGKSTLAKWLNSHLSSKGFPVVWLDGDEMRSKLFQEFGYGIAHRQELAFKYHNLAEIIYSHNVSVIVSTVSLFQNVQRINRESFVNYQEIYLEVNIDLLERGPRKDQYSTLNEGESPRKLEEKPLNPSLHLTAESHEDRLTWMSQLEAYLESI
jgi:adenylylsulfate kinase-like enzyme